MAKETKYKVVKPCGDKDATLLLPGDELYGAETFVDVTRLLTLGAIEEVRPEKPAATADEKPKK